ncbi:MAG: alpha/beta fold hydrolase [Myxococcota bacterium]
MKKKLLVAAAVLLALVGAGVARVWEPDRPVSALLRWAPPPSQFVEVDGLKVHLRDQGLRDDAEPIVLIHGTSASLHTWEGWVERLAPRHRVISLDLPAFGLTGPFPDDDNSVAHHVRFFDALFQKLGVTRAIVVGNSWGGRLAWELAVQRPALVSRLVLVDAAGYPLESQSVPLGFRIAKTPGLRGVMEYVLPRGVVEASVRNVYGDPSKVTDALVDRYFELTLREGNRRALGLRFAQVPMVGEVERLKALRMPTLILWGGLDRLIPPSHAERFHDDIPGSELVMFEQLGHVPHEEDPAATVAAFEAWLVKPPAQPAP